MYRDNNQESFERSYMPERELIDLGDIEALKFKYEAEYAVQAARPSERDRARQGVREDLDRIVETEEEEFEGIFLHIGGRSRIEASDPIIGATIAHESTDAMTIHVEYYEGLHHIQNQLRKIGQYILQHEALRETPYVMGSTYREMARIGVALGARQLNIHYMDDWYRASLRAQHAVTFAKSTRPHSFEPAAIYLPTDEFVERFYTSDEDKV